MPTDNTTEATNAAAPPEATEPAGTTSDQPKGWRAHLKIHPAAELFPLMNEAELRELAADIDEYDLTELVCLYDDPELGVCVLDGRNRLDALERLNWQTGFQAHEPPPSGKKPVLDDGLYQWVGRFDPTFEPYAYVLSKNVHRRHLTSAQKHELIAKVLKATPEKSDRLIGDELNVDHHKVADERRSGEATGEIPPVKKRTGKDGRARQAPKASTSKPKAALPAPKKTATPKPKRITALDALAVWKDLPEAEHRRFFDGIGLNAILAGIPEAWLPALEEWVAKRRINPAPVTRQ
jgi:hypothetical protein